MSPPALARALLALPALSFELAADPAAEGSEEPYVRSRACPCCHFGMLIIEVFGLGCEPRRRATPAITRVDTSWCRECHELRIKSDARRLLLGEKLSRARIETIQSH